MFCHTHLQTEHLTGDPDLNSGTFETFLIEEQKLLLCFARYGGNGEHG